MPVCARTLPARDRIRCSGHHDELAFSMASHLSAVKIVSCWTKLWYFLSICLSVCPWAFLRVFVIMTVSPKQPSPFLVLLYLLLYILLYLLLNLSLLLSLSLSLCPVGLPWCFTYLLPTIPDNSTLFHRTFNNSIRHRETHNKVFFNQYVRNDLKFFLLLVICMICQVSSSFTKLRLLLFIYFFKYK